MEYNNRVICGIFHVIANFYENLEYVLGNVTSLLIIPMDNMKNSINQINIYVKYIT